MSCRMIFYWLSKRRETGNEMENIIHKISKHTGCMAACVAMLLSVMISSLVQTQRSKKVTYMCYVEMK